MAGHKKNKFGNKKVKLVYRGKTFEFDSKKEAARFNVLTGLLEQGKISGLSVHPAFDLQAGFEIGKKKIRPITYEADFRYFDNEKQQTVIEDVKSKFTRTLPVYKLKMKLFLHNLPINTVFVELC